MLALSDGTILWSTVHYGLSHPQQSFWFRRWQAPVKCKEKHGFTKKETLVNLETYTAQIHPRMCTIPQEHQLHTVNISLLGISCLASPPASLFSCQGLPYLTVFKNKSGSCFPECNSKLNTHRVMTCTIFLDAETTLLLVTTDDNLTFLQLFFILKLSSKPQTPDDFDAW